MIINAPRGVDFLGAVQLFPAFCSEVPEGSTLSIRQICRRELTAFFAYLLDAEKVSGQAFDETAAPFVSYAGVTNRDLACWEEEVLGSPASPNCVGVDTTDRQFIHNPEARYYARGNGPEPLVGHVDYGKFSRRVFGDMKVLADDPNMILKDPRLTMAVALYRWFEPRHNQISLHDVAIQNFALSDADKNFGYVQEDIFNNVFAFRDPTAICANDADIKSGFWATQIPVLAKLTQLILPDAPNLSCTGVLEPVLILKASNELSIYFHPRPSTDKVNACYLSVEPSPYIVYIQGDYKRCTVEHFS